tara:strand:+ start:89 stop:262 length:174 start_codon:yes stop_codon:yes gene_type:complete
MTLEQIQQKFKQNFNDLPYLEGLILEMIKLWETNKGTTAYTVFSNLDDRILELKGKN